MEIDEFRWSSKYPFDVKARELLKHIALDVGKYQEEDLKFLLEEAIERIIKHFKNEFVTNWTNDYREVVIFYLSMLIIRGTQNDYLYKVFSEKEAKRAFQLLRNDKISALLTIAENLGLRTRLMDDGNIYLNVLDFIDLTRTIYSPSWRLYNFALKSGYVSLNATQLARLCTQKIKKLIYEMIRNIESVPDFINEYSLKLLRHEYINKLVTRSTNASLRIDNIRSGEKFPPCIEEMLNNIGNNLPHSARFTLVTFLHKIGYSVSDIIEIFRRSPDFNEKIAQYQVEHIVGLRGSRIEYNVPTCKKILSYGFCRPDEFCRNIKHPLQYLTKVLRKTKNRVN
ncbi:MAG: hypothetical protein QXH96_00190 [Candidatus Geothermarchaeota archaeon]